MCDFTLFCGRRHFCHYFLQAFQYRKNIMLNCHVKFALKLMLNKWLRCLKMGEYVSFKNSEVEIKSSFMTYAYFENTLLPEDNGK